MPTPQETLDAAIALHTQGRLAEAVPLYREVLSVHPDHPDALHLLGVIAHQTGNHEQAATLIGQAIRRWGNAAIYHCNLGEALRSLGRFDLARAAHQQALRLDPRFVAAHNNLGTVYEQQGRYDEALACFNQAIALDPDCVDAHYNRARMWLALGNFDRGWAEYEWRWRRAEFTRPTLGQPEWDGTPLAGRRLLVRAEQGLGDTLQFARYVPLLQAQGAIVQFEVQPSLIPLLTHSGIGPLVVQGTSPAPFDVHATLLSLPGLLRTTLENIPAEVPYLAADETLVAQWRERLRGVSGFRVGIGWQGNPQFPHDRWRSMPLREFAPLARVDGARLVCLQKSFGLEQMAALGGAFEIADLRPDYDVEDGAFLNAAAILRNLEVLVTTDTALGHLAGALGARVWLLLSVGADWRWLADRCDSPWYPTMRLFRQSRHGDWSELMQRVAAELTMEVNSARRPD
ncbi:MAG: tetratricopeptide repeat protein [Pirellulales bacterium]